MYPRPKGLYLLWSYTAWREQGHQHQWYLHQGPGTLLPLPDLPSRPLGQLRASWKHRVFSHVAPGKSKCPSHTASQSPTKTLLCSEGKLCITYDFCITLHRQQQAQGAACDLMGLCTKKLRICMHPNSHCISLLRSFWKCQPYKFWPLHPYLQAWGRQQINSQKKQTFVLIFFKDLDFSD